LLAVAPTQLPWQVCKRETVNGLEPARRWTPPCAGNYCIYQKTNKAAHFQGYSYTKQCSTTNDFDVFYTGMPFMFYPECCANVTYGGQPDEAVCYGSMNLRTTLVIDVSILIRLIAKCSIFCFYSIDSKMFIFLLLID
uniref:LCCL domain-containing protein n=1 Tax=Heligmosomoides polygyrus TaxID=6339 RepID=A0A183G5D8_HELPZ